MAALLVQFDSKASLDTFGTTNAKLLLDAYELDNAATHGEMTGALNGGIFSVLPDGMIWFNEFEFLRYIREATLTANCRLSLSSQFKSDTGIRFDIRSTDNSGFITHEHACFLWHILNDEPHVSRLFIRKPATYLEESPLTYFEVVLNPDNNQPLRLEPVFAYDNTGDGIAGLASDYYRAEIDLLGISSGSPLNGI